MLQRGSKEGYKNGQNTEMRTQLLSLSLFDSANAKSRSTVTRRSRVRAHITHARDRKKLEGTRLKKCSRTVQNRDIRHRGPQGARARLARGWGSDSYDVRRELPRYPVPN